MFYGIIKDAVSEAIRDTMPGAIKSALGWHTSIHIVEKEVTREVFAGMKAEMPKLPEAVYIKQRGYINPPSEIVYKPTYKEVTKLVRFTYFDQYRFNPVTGDTEWRKDENPMTEVFDI